jgi:N6-L-threonylcarbamoyladenine synthase
MIALAGALRLAAGQHETPSIFVHPRWDLAGLAALDAA